MALQEVQNLESLVNKAHGRRKIKVPALPAMLQKLSKETQVWIYNVSPWVFTREMGSIGTWRIPACPEGKEYAKALPVPGVFVEPVQGQDPNNMELRTEPGGGLYVAEQIVGIGAFMHPRNSLVNQGVFIGSEVGPNAKPTKEELVAAKQKLYAYLEELVNEARKSYEKGKPNEIVERHRQAARMLRLENEQWYSQRTAKAREECPSCGTIVNKGVKICPSCHFAIDKEWYEKNKASFAK